MGSHRNERVTRVGNQLKREKAVTRESSPTSLCFLLFLMGPCLAHMF